MLRPLIALIVVLLSPKPQVLNVDQVDKVLKPSVLIRAKVYEINPDTLETVGAELTIAFWEKAETKLPLEKELYRAVVFGKRQHSYY